MSENLSGFMAKSIVKSGDKEHRRKINFNIGKYNGAVVQGKMQFEDLDTAREKAKNLKWKALEQLDKHLENFEAQITNRGAKVIWVEDDKQALAAIEKICKEKNCRSVVKSKSMVSEEIGLNEFLHELGIESVETDLGEFIQQLDHEPPYHIVTPAMHKSKEDVARLFAEKLGTDSKASPEQLTMVARKILREKYVQAEIGITGANFLIGDTGAVCVTENEGNARLSCAFPKTHIVIAGIEKMIPSLADLQIFWPLLATFGTGQRITVYNSIITGPRQSNEMDGPTDMYVILLDNGRTRILADEKQRESLYCIRCGACLNACPVYKTIGGHAYAAAYSGPIGSVITPNMKNFQDWKHLSYASSLCGNCTEVCAVKINLHELLLDNRHKAVEDGHNKLKEKAGWKMWKQAMLHRTLMNTGGGIKSFMINTFLRSWQKHRGKLEFPRKSFNQLWKEKNKSH